MSAPHIRLLVLLSLILSASNLSWAVEPTGKADAKLGRDLFLRKWKLNDARSPNGDGLGPVFNEESCVSCHHQGSIGGGGTNDKNVLLMHAFESNQVIDRSLPNFSEVFAKAFTDVHPGFANSRTTVIHLDGDEDYLKWFESEKTVWFREKTTTTPPEPFKQNVSRADQLATRFNREGRRLREKGISLVMSTRNPPPLFGLGLIDGIPEETLRELAARRVPKQAEITGRLCLLPDGRVGRFGWKAQIPTLSEFVLAACANELGLEVDLHAQAVSPANVSYRAPGPDMTPHECDSLVQFIRELPQPETLAAKSFEAGRKAFNHVGCNGCHVEKVAHVDGIYSDLLLHDLGTQLSGAGEYYSTIPNLTEEEQLAGAEEPQQRLGRRKLTTDDALTADGKPLIGSRSREWRTPPLWGLRDSAPYMHDGRAATLADAISMHGGEAEKCIARYQKLPDSKKREMTVFLNSLVAPDSPGVAFGTDRRLKPH